SPGSPASPAASSGMRPSPTASPDVCSTPRGPPRPSGSSPRRPSRMGSGGPPNGIDDSPRSGEVRRAGLSRSSGGDANGRPRITSDGAVSVIIGPPSGSAARYLDPVRMLRSMWRHRELVLRLTSQDIAQRYRGSFLGIVWLFIIPILMLSVYAFVFSIIFEARWGELARTTRTGEFALTLFAGLIPFSVFSEVVNRAPSIILGSPNYVKKVVFPLEILPVVAVGSAVVHSLISSTILLAGSAALLGYVSPAVVLLPLSYLPLVLLTLGLG